MTESTKDWQKILSSPWPIIGTWWVAGILSILIPFFVRRSEKNAFYSTYGQAIEYDSSNAHIKRPKMRTSRTRMMMFKRCRVGTAAGGSSDAATTVTLT
jgi:hypothetical protein